MLRFAFVVSVLCLSVPSCLLAGEVSESLAKDAEFLARTKGKSWKTEPLNLQFQDGTTGQRILVMEFASSPLDRPGKFPQVQVKLSLATVPEGPFQVHSSISTGGFRDARFEDDDDRPYITITRSIDSVSKPGKKTQRILELTAISFAYELNEKSMMLKGFPESPTSWGQLSFTVSQHDVVFHLSK